MSIALINKIKPMTGFTFAEKSILFQLADASYDGETVFLRLEKLALYAGCSVRTAQRALRKLEQKGVMIPEGGTGGRGYVNKYRFNLDPSPPEASAVDPPPPAEVPGINGKAPPAAEGELPKVPVTVPDYESSNPRKRRPGESFMDYSNRMSQLPPEGK